MAARSAATRSTPRSAAALLLAANRTPQFALLASSASRTLSTTPARLAEGEGDAEDKKKALKESLKTYDQVKSKVEKVCKEFEKINQEKFSLNVRLQASTYPLSACCSVYVQSIDNDRQFHMSIRIRVRECQAARAEISRTSMSE